MHLQVSADNILWLRDYADHFIPAVPTHTSSISGQKNLFFSPQICACISPLCQPHRYQQVLERVDHHRVQLHIAQAGQTGHCLHNSPFLVVLSMAQKMVWHKMFCNHARPGCCPQEIEPLTFRIDSAGGHKMVQVFSNIWISFLWIN